MLMILRYTPLWVWGLLAALLALGLWQTRDRRVALGRVVALPLTLLVLGLSSLLPSFAAQPGAAMVWLASLTASIAAGRRWLRPAGAAWLADVRRLALPGSWLPLALILTIFTLRYGLSVGQVMHPALRSDASFLVASALVYGLLNGLFVGRALGLLELARRRPATIAA